MEPTTVTSQSQVNTAILVAFGQIAEMQKAVANARKAAIEMLPAATTEQVNAVVRVTREVDVSGPDSEVAAGMNKAFRLTEEQRDQLAAARAEHRVIINRPEVKQEAADYIRNAYLKSYKLRATKSGRVSVSVSGLL